MRPDRIAIIGGGFSGIMLAVNLLRHSRARISLIERADRLARGIAFSTRLPEHLLNVRAAAMSAFPEAPTHFADWLQARGEGDGATFAPRRRYGEYLEQLFGEAALDPDERLTVIPAEAVDIRAGEGGETIHFASGAPLTADAAILSVGNLAPQTPPVFAGLPGDVYQSDPWSGDIAAGLGRDDTVLLVGTGLTAIDAALMLDAAGFKGKVVALSRRGLVPRAHPEPAVPVPALTEPPVGSCAGLTRAVRRRAEAIGWHGAVDQLRPHTQALWASAPVAQRRRFLRHLRPWWDVHRHRIAPAIAARIDEMGAQGRLAFRPGKIASAGLAGKAAEIVFFPRGSEASENLRVCRIVNCTGPSGNVESTAEPLLANLVASGRIRPDPCRIGIDVDAGQHVIGRDGLASDSLYAIGPMTRGAWWEIVAVPDIRIQVDALARRLAA